MISPCCRNPVTTSPQVSRTRWKTGNRAMRTWSSLLIAAPVALGLLAAPAAHADWRHHGGGCGGGWHGFQHRDDGNCDAVDGELIGLGAGCRTGGMLTSTHPRNAPPPPVPTPPPPPYSAPVYA